VKAPVAVGVVDVPTGPGPVLSSSRKLRSISSCAWSGVLAEKTVSLAVLHHWLGGSTSSTRDNGLCSAAS
jgi:hypothetical protein